MARTRTYDTQGVVLKHMRLGEADRIVTLYTVDRGKVSAVVKGARRITSRKGGFLQPLSHVRVSIAEGRTLDQVVEAETVAIYRAAREDLRRMSAGLYFAELVDGFSVDGAANPSEFHLLVGALHALDCTGDPERLARYFETRLLSIAGFGPEMRQCVGCDMDLPAGDYTFSCGEGGLVDAECKSRCEGPLVYASMNTIKVVRFFQTADFSQALDLRLTDGLMGNLRQILGRYIAHVLEREPRSAEFMRLVGSA